MSDRRRIRRRELAREEHRAPAPASTHEASTDRPTVLEEARREEQTQVPAQPTVSPIRHSFSRVTVLQPQPKLTLTEPTDPAEQEAEEIAEEVVSADPTSLDPARTPKASGRSARTSSAPSAGGADPHDDSNIAKRVEPVLRDGGAPLDTVTRSFFEPRFGHDFGEIRVHTDARASESAKSMSAQAYAVGNNIVFGAGRYAPGTTDGRHLLAHELTHTIQQASGSAAVARRFDNDPPKSAYDATKIDLAKATEPEKIAEIQRLLGDATPEAKRAISMIWGSFGDLAGVAKANGELFEKSCTRAPEICNQSAFQPIRDEFKTAVQNKVTANLEANRKYVREEMAKLGISETDKPDAAPTAEQDKALAETQKAAEQASKAQKAKAMLQTVAVGTSKQIMAVSGGGLPPRTVDEHYSPNGRPTSPGFKEEKGPGYRSWDDVDKEYKKADAALQKILSTVPAVYAIISGEGDPNFKQIGDKSAATAAAKPEDARKTIKPAMIAVLLKIDDAVGKVDSLDYRDFIPVHDQLMSGPKFGGAVEKTIIKHDVEGHETTKMLRSLGLGALAAAAFILAEFATAGMATFLLVAAGIGAGAANAALSIEDYQTKRQLAQGTSGNKELDIISNEQVDSALFAAVIDTVFVFLDGAGAIVGGLSKSARVAAKLVEAAEEGAAKAASKAVAEAIVHGGPGAVSAIERSITEVGVKGTMSATGKTAEQLAEIVGKETELGKRIAAAAEVAGKAGGKELEALAENLAKLGTLEKAEMERVVKASIDQFGTMGTVRKAGGWKVLTKALGKDGGVATGLMQWRESLVRDLENWIAKESQGATKAVQTGTTKSPVSDIDISTFGEDAAQNVKRSREFVAGRAGCKSDELEALLDLDIFADPSRMHLQDVTKGLSDEVRREISRSAAKYEEQLIFGRRLYDAKQAGNEALVAQIRKDAEALGLKPFEGYKPLSKAEVDTLTSRLDGLAKKLETATEAEKKQIIEEMGQTQGQILAEGGGGYATGGGVRLNVTERPMDMGKMPKVLTPRWPEVRYTAILAEGPHMQSAIQKLGVAGKTAEEYAGAVKNIGKHGNRITEVLGADVAKAPANLSKLGDDLLSWVEKAKDPEFVKSLKNVQELAKIREEIAAQLGQLKGASDSGLKALREEAELGAAMTPEQMANIQAWTKHNAAVTALANQIDTITPAVFEGIHAGITTMPTGTEDEKKQASIPSPPVSAPPPPP